MQAAPPGWDLARAALGSTRKGKKPKQFVNVTNTAPAPGGRCPPLAQAVLYPAAS